MNKDQLDIFKKIVTDYCEVLVDNYFSGHPKTTLERDYYDFVTGLQTMYVVAFGTLGLSEMTATAHDIKIKHWEMMEDNNESV